MFLKVLVIVISNAFLLGGLIILFGFYSTMTTFENNSRYSEELKQHAQVLYVQVNNEGKDE